MVSPRAAGEGRETVTVLHRFHFSSALKRMAALVRVRLAGSAFCSEALGLVHFLCILFVCAAMP